VFWKEPCPATGGALTHGRSFLCQVHSPGQCCACGQVDPAYYRPWVSYGTGPDLPGRPTDDREASRPSGHPSILPAGMDPSTASMLRGANLNKLAFLRWLYVHNLEAIS